MFVWLLLCWAKDYESVYQNETQSNFLARGER